ncbi:hypothetical protein BX600DRAFT_505871 [Xylariales sp. PMI_506]|nr:hypothetical protein BX600DRAFT_505871 [Xylariales sp. PMI_506]
MAFASRIPILPGQLKFLAALGSVALPVAYIIYLDRCYSSQTTTTNTRSPPALLSAAQPSSLPSDANGEEMKDDGDDDDAVIAKLDGHSIFPPEVLAAPSEWVVARERVVSRRLELPTALKLPRAPAEAATNKKTTAAAAAAILESYLQTTMRLFGRTPQAWLMRRACPSSEEKGEEEIDARLTFDAVYLSQCRFAHGDRVCGAYVVAARAPSRVVMSLSPPEGWTGPVVRGRLVCEVEIEDNGGGNGDGAAAAVRLLNETIVWRRKKGEKPTFLESNVGRWAHAFMVRWMMVKGVEAVEINLKDPSSVLEAGVRVFDHVKLGGFLYTFASWFTSA